MKLFPHQGMSAIKCLIFILFTLQLTQPLVIQDLTSTDSASLTREAGAWTWPSLKNAGVVSYVCNGLALIGGYNIVANPKSSWVRTYPNLPTHNLITLGIWVQGLDSWDYSGDSFYIFSDSNTFNGWAFDMYGSGARSGTLVNICGNGGARDYPPVYIEWSVPHTASSAELWI